MPAIELPIIPPTAPEGFCATLGADWVQQILNLMGEGVAIYDSGSGNFKTILVQETVPDADQRDYVLWYRPSTGYIYNYSGGAWIKPNPSPASGNERRLFEGTPAEIWSYDGGDGSDPSVTAPSTNVGAMWEIDTAYTGRSPMGPGAIPSSDAGLTKTLALSEEYGIGSYVQTEAQMPEHTHDLVASSSDTGSANPQTGSGDGTDFTWTTETKGDGDPINNVHPVRGCYVIKRTARVNYVAS